MTEIKKLQSKHGLPFINLCDSQGNMCPFIGGIYQPVSQKQFDDLLENHAAEIEEASAGMAPANISELRDAQIMSANQMLDAENNVSESEKGEIRPATTATMNAITAGITPVSQAASKAAAATAAAKVVAAKRQS